MSEFFQKIKSVFNLLITQKTKITVTIDGTDVCLQAIVVGQEYMEKSSGIFLKKIEPCLKCLIRLAPPIPDFFKMAENSKLRLFIESERRNFTFQGKIIKSLGDFEYWLEIDPEFSVHPRRVYTRFENPLNNEVNADPIRIRDISIDGLCLMFHKQPDFNIESLLKLHIRIPVFEEKKEIFMDQYWRVRIKNIHTTHGIILVGCMLIDPTREYLSDIQKFILKIQKKVKVPPMRMIAYTILA